MFVCVCVMLVFANFSLKYGINIFLIEMENARMDDGSIGRRWELLKDSFTRTINLGQIKRIIITSLVSTKHQL